MTEQIKALQLAQELDAYHTRSCHKEAAAELRRQHEENERLFKLAEDQDSVIRRQRAERQELEAQRDVLLRAIRWIATVNAMDYEYQAKAQAAIEAVGKNT